MFKLYVRGLLLNEKNEILLLRKNNQQKLGAGNWMPPGGTVEFGETPSDTLIRECKEELNLEVIEAKLFSTEMMIIQDTHWQGLYYLIKVKSFEYQNREPEKHAEVSRFSFDNLPQMPHIETIKSVFVS